MTINEKLAKFRRILEEIGSAVVAFSGGLDSTFLAKVAADVLKGKVLAVTMVSALIPESERKEAARLARQINVPHRFVVQRGGTAVWNNPPDRCYHCKKEIFPRLLRIAQREKFAAVLDGSNIDDLADYRPGARALKDLGIRSPLQEAELIKKDIRVLSKRMGLSTWNKPAMACLASRFPYGKRITRREFQMVEQAEEFLHDRGFVQVRARHHGDLCRIEVKPSDVARLLKKQASIVPKIKSFGYTYVTVDLEGYRTGSMNEAFRWKKKK
jgi:pyridinium-3,5-biscarboxylic acid mononucleotide sulfurtransferase